MTSEDKELLLKDFCGRLPYKIKAQIPDEYGGYTSIIESIDIDGFVVDFEGAQIEIECIKPYLFPMSSMNRAQREEFIKFADYEPRAEDCGRHQELYYYDLVGHENNLYPNSDAIDWLNKNHFDYRGLIPRGLAKDATGLNIYK